MTKLKNTKFLIPIISIAILLISVVILLAVIIPKNSHKNNLPLTVFANDLELFVEDECSDFLTCNKDNTTFNFSLDKENIISISATKIKALNPGTVTVNIIAKNQNQTAKESFTVTVKNKNYTYLITANENCLYENNTLILQSEYSSFSFVLYDLTNKIVLDSLYLLVYTDGTPIQKEFSNYILNKSLLKSAKSIKCISSTLKLEITIPLNY